MAQNGQTHFKNLAAFAARFLKCVNHFGTLCIKGLRPISPKTISEELYQNLLCIPSNVRFKLLDKYCYVKEFIIHFFTEAVN